MQKDKKIIIQKTYLVTGGAGFIGSHIVDQLIELDNKVIVIDNLVTGLKKNINKKAHFIKGDIRNTKDLEKAFSYKPWGVFHCAALARIQPSIKNPIETNDVNINGTLKLLQFARTKKVKRFVHSASSSVYAGCKELLLKEDVEAKPLNPYALQKLVGEKYCEIFNSLYGLSTISLRYFNVYGSRMIPFGAYATVMTIFQKQYKNKKPLTIVGNGRQRRDFTFITDVVKANLLAMESQETGLFNIGCGINYSINQLAKMMYPGYKTINIIPRPGEAKETLADNSKAKKKLGWTPDVNLKQGLKYI